MIQELKKVEERMQDAFLHNHFDTFNQLACERLDLLRKARNHADYVAILEDARRETDRWVGLLEQKVEKARKQLSLKDRYANTPSSRGMLNRVV